MSEGAGAIPPPFFFLRRGSMMPSMVVGSMVVAIGLWAAPIAPAPEVDERARREALAHYRAGQEFMYAESWPEAEREFRAAIRLDPLLVLAHYSLGQTYMSMRRYPDAVRAFTLCRQAFLDVRGLLSSDRVRADQRLDEQIEELKQTIRSLHGMKAGPLENAILKLEQRVRELEDLRRRGAAGTTEVPAEFSLALGSAHFRTGALADAQREYEAAVRVRPGFGEAHNNLAVVLMLQGRLEEARQHARLAEKAGHRVSPAFKADLERRLRGS